MTPARPGLRVGVIGEGVCSRRVAALAERVGRAIAEAGAVLLCGGLGGVMEAASRGAAQAGGLVVGLLPGFEARDANRWVGVPIVTGMDQARNVVLVRSCDVVLFVAGAMGSLNEFTIAHDEGKIIGCLTGTGGVADESEYVLQKFGKRATSSRVFQNEDPDKLLELCLQNM